MHGASLHGVIIDHCILFLFLGVEEAPVVGWHQKDLSAPVPGQALLPGAMLHISMLFHWQLSDYRGCQQPHATWHDVVAAAAVLWRTSCAQAGRLVLNQCRFALSCTQ